MHFIQKNYGVLFFILCSISLLTGFYFNLDVSTGGTSSDFQKTWTYIQSLKDNLFVMPGSSTAHMPLHYMLMSLLNRLIVEPENLRLFFVLLSLLLPLLFNYCLRIRFTNTSKNKIWLVSSLIFLLPSFRYSAIWANAHITALFFFLLSIFFFLKFKNSNHNKKINKFVLIQLLFMAFAVYARQYYALFFIFYLYFFLKEMDFKNFTLTTLYIFLLSIPGWIMIYYNPFYLGDYEVGFFSLKVYNTFLIIPSILSAYLIPKFTIFAYHNRGFFLENKKILFIIFLASFIIVCFCSYFFNYNFKLGGGVFLKASRYFLDNNILFYISSFIGISCIFYLCNQHRDNLVIFLIILFGFSGIFIMQKYFEPMFLFIFFLLLKSDLIDTFFKKNIYIIFVIFYYIFYYISALLNSFYKFSLSI
tara:strand:+ start:781 stop:2034 length:1254 start_codon:yes stop_codon:yes gene_type:complete